MMAKLACAGALRESAVSRHLGDFALLRLIGATSLLIFSAMDAQAQAVKCSAFLHNTDGSWRSFEAATVVGSYGPVKIEPGEIFKRGAARDKADIARILESLCG